MSDNFDKKFKEVFRGQIDKKMEKPDLEWSQLVQKIEKDKEKSLFGLFSPWALATAMSLVLALIINQQLTKPSVSDEQLADFLLDTQEYYADNGEEYEESYLALMDDI